MANVKISELPVLQKLGNTGATPAATRNWDFAYTWNSGGTTFTADYMNITDSASAAGSKLIDRRVGGVSKFSVNKAGGILVGGTTYGFNEFGILTFASIFSGSCIEIKTGGETKWASNSVVGFSSTTNVALSADTAWERVSAGVVGWNNGTSGARRGFMGGGAAVASAAALPLPTGRVFHVTGTTGITSITSTNFQAGVVITLIFDGTLTVTDGSNLNLAGNFSATAGSTLTLVYDGTNWYECSRSIN